MSAPLRTALGSAVLLRVDENYGGPVIKGDGMAFGSDIRRSEDEDGKDFMQQIHDSETFWTEVVKGYRDGWL